jgi:site-specific DNA recombinase
MQSTINAVEYVRYSSDNQREESIEAQRRAIREFADRNGYRIVSTYADEALSATTDNRPQFLQMVSDSKKGTFQVVICHKLDRFARNRYDSAFYKKTLKENGVRLVSVLENFDDSPESIILESVLEGMAEYYSANLAREVKKGLKENALECRHTGGKPPFGYDLDNDKKYIINENEAKAIKAIFEKTVNGETTGEVIGWLNINNYKSKYGTKFAKNAVNAIIRNEKYKGVYVYGKYKRVTQDGVKKNIAGDNIIRIPDGVPRIVDDETWEKANQIFDARARVAGGQATAKETYLLSGKIKCAACGRSMSGARIHSGRNKTLRITYKCTGRKNNTGCRAKDIKKDFVEGYVLDKLELILSEISLNNLIDEISKNALQESNELPEVIKSLKTELTLTDGQLNNAMEFVLGGLKSQTVIDKINELEEKKKGILDKLHYLEHRNESLKIDRTVIYNHLVKFTKIKEKSLELQRKAINTFIKEIAVSDSKINITWEFTADNGSSAPLDFLVILLYESALNLLFQGLKLFYSFMLK